MVEEGLTFFDLSDPANDQKVAEFLKSVADKELIDYVKQILEIDPNLNLSTLGDLLDAKKILPRSYDYNYFENINDNQKEKIHITQDILSLALTYVK